MFYDADFDADTVAVRKSLRGQASRASRLSLGSRSFFVKTFLDEKTMDMILIRNDISISHAKLCQLVWGTESKTNDTCSYDMVQLRDMAMCLKSQLHLFVALCTGRNIKSIILLTSKVLLAHTSTT